MTKSQTVIGGLAMLALAGCGANGEPETPAPPPQVTTSVGLGIGIGSGGTYFGGGVGLHQGPVSVFVGF